MSAVSTEQGQRDEARFNMVLPAYLLSAVQRIARDNDRSTSAEVRRAIAAHVARENPLNDGDPTVAREVSEQQVGEDAPNVLTG